MNRYKLYKQSLVICLPVLIFLSCIEEQIDSTSIGHDNDNLEIRITIDNGILDTGPNSGIDTRESINRLDVFVHHQDDDSLFVHLHPKLLSGNTYIATLKDSMHLDKIKDVYVVANLDEQLVDSLIKLTSDEVMNFIITSPQQFNDADSTFQSPYLMSASVLKYDFSIDRVMDIQLERIYSKVRLKFIYDYSDADIDTPGDKAVEPTYVRVSMKPIRGLPDNVSLFHQGLATVNPWEISNFQDSIPLLINGEEITEMNDASKENEDRFYDFLSNKPYLKLYPTLPNDTTLIPLSLDFYEKKDSLPVVRFTKNIILKKIEANTEYLITLHINRMDSNKRGAKVFDATINCWYEVSARPYRSAI